MDHAGKPHLVLGIDPGLSGALALYDPQTRQLIKVISMPTFKNKKGRKRIDLLALALFFDEHAPTIKFVVIEDVHSMPDQGVASTFTFGVTLGTVEGAAAAWYLPIHKVSPQAWKYVFKLDSDKNKSRFKAMELFPEKASEFVPKGADGKAEASILCVYGELYCA